MYSWIPYKNFSHLTETYIAICIIYIVTAMDFLVDLSGSVNEMQFFFKGSFLPPVPKYISIVSIVFLRR